MIPSMTINCKGKLLDLSKPKVMGILNLTPDSFYDGGRNQQENLALKRIEIMISEGLDILDIGGQTTKPGSEMISSEEELNRISSILVQIRKNFPDVIISIDTFYSAVAKEAIDLGAHIVNDISAGSIDKKMFETVADLNVPYILMHMQGKPKNMQHQPSYENIIIEINQFFSEKIQKLKALQINDIILDPGYGFGKTTRNNFELLKNQKLIGFGDYPLLIGVSRKSMICKTLNIKPNNALNGTTAIHMLALQNGAKILRVHDVKEAKECIQLYESYDSIQIL